jgi:polyisoprenoid-binding protein YceI
MLYMTTTTRGLDGSFTADPHHSSLVFAVQHMKVSSFRATFGDVEARLQGGESGLSLEGRARVASVSITNPPAFREHVVNGEDFFDAGNHPEVVFRSTRVELAEDGGVAVYGELEIKGIAKPVTATGTYHAPVEDAFGATRTAIGLHTVIDRRDWDMNWQMPLPAGGDALGYEVEISVSLELVKRG